MLFRSGFASGSVSVTVKDDGTADGEIVDVDASDLEFDADVDTYGPFRCTQCRKEYDQIPPVAWLASLLETSHKLLHTDSELNIFGGHGEVK